jgi:hypothetical protein
LAELRWGIEGGVDRSSAHHGLEVGGEPMWHGVADGEAAVLSQLEEEEGCRPRLDGPRGPLSHPEISILECEPFSSINLNFQKVFI